MPGTQGLWLAAMACHDVARGQIDDVYGHRGALSPWTPAPARHGKLGLLHLLAGVSFVKWRLRPLKPVALHLQ